MNVFEASVLIAALLAAGAAHAVRAIDAPPPTRAAVLNTPRPDAAAQADDSSSLRQGVVGDVSANGERVYVNGTWLFVAEGTTRLFRQGRAVPATSLSKGQLLKFTLAPGAADRKTLGIVYVP